MDDEAAIADLISRAHNSGVRVLAAYGAPDWPSLGCNPTGFPMQRISEVVSYNNANPAAKFDGIMLDIEPPEPQSTSDFQALLSQYACIRNAMPNELQLAVAIRFFWDTTVPYNSASKPVYQHIIDMPMNHVVVMGYRDFAGPADCTSDGIICLDKDEVGYAASVGKPQLVLAGLETADPAAVGITNKETFYEEGEAAMNGRAQAVIGYFGHNSGLGGFAIDNYEASYLAGSNSWPVTNPAFPSNELSCTIRLLSGGTIHLSGVGVPSHQHTLRWSSNVNTTFTLITVTPDANGNWNYDDPGATAASSRFYKLSLP